jgi:2-hydroxy-3-keto-5-methylthiopentenyl-1-phosphate phosphatase
MFVDFDGTISRQDVGNGLFRRFGGAACDALVARYHAGEIGARECFRGEAAAMGRFSVADMDRWIDLQEIDESFGAFAAFCAEAGMELAIVSDGLDYYIRRILAPRGLGGIRLYANALSFEDLREDGTARAQIAFPHADAECGCSGSCKRNIVLTTTADDEILCYVGEGFSDRCPATFADIVFARDALQTYCQEQNISYFPYTSFADVAARMGELIARPRVRPRRQAQANRRAAFIRES